MRAEGLFGEAVDRIGGESIPARMARKAPIRHLDPMLLLVGALLATYGAVMIYSVTVHSQIEQGLDPNLFMMRQVAYILAGMGALVAIGFVDYRYLKSFAPFIYGAVVIGLAVVLSPLGDVSGGARRWIDFGAFQAQPSELMKVAVIISLAAYIAERKGEPLRARDVGFCLGLVVLPSALIYLEPDLGTMMVLVAITGGLLLVGGARIRHFLVLGLIGLIGFGAAWQFGLLADYQKQRLKSFLDPDPNVQSVGWNLVQAKIAIASGGVRGKGLDVEPRAPEDSTRPFGIFPLEDAAGPQGGELPRASQTALDFVPEQHTDFIFTAVGEQLGFLGSATLLGLFAMLIWRAIRIASMSKDIFGTLVAAGIATMWAFQLFVNVGMTMGIMPITGIPLPFISYGGSSMLTNFIAVGVLLNIHMRRFL